MRDTRRTPPLKPFTCACVCVRVFVCFCRCPLAINHKLFFIHACFLFFLLGWKTPERRFSWTSRARPEFPRTTWHGDRSPRTRTTTAVAAVALQSTTQTPHLGTVGKPAGSGTTMTKAVAGRETGEKRGAEVGVGAPAAVHPKEGKSGN